MPASRWRHHFRILLKTGDEVSREWATGALVRAKKGDGALIGVIDSAGPQPDSPYGRLDDGRAVVVVAVLADQLVVRLEFCDTRIVGSVVTV